MLKMGGADAQFRRMLGNGMILRQRILHLQTEYAELLRVGVGYLNLSREWSAAERWLNRTEKRASIFLRRRAAMYMRFPEKLSDQNRAGLKVIQQKRHITCQGVRQGLPLFQFKVNPVIGIIAVRIAVHIAGSGRNDDGMSRVEEIVLVVDPELTLAAKQRITWLSCPCGRDNIRMPRVCWRSRPSIPS